MTPDLQEAEKQWGYKLDELMETGLRIHRVSSPDDRDSPVEDREITKAQALRSEILVGLAVADSPDVTTRLAEAEDRAAKAEERAEKAEAEVASWSKAYDLLKRAWTNEANRAIAVEAQVADLTRKLDEARGVLRDCEWCIEDNRSDTICPICLGVNRHYSACRLAAVIAPETGKESQG